jgi:glycosyltransferase involved in cell wall biosynthesis
MIILSIVICTWNRPRFLRGALEALVSQGEALSSVEIIVVDNCQNEETRAVVEACSQHNAILRYCTEGVQGVSHARNRGWKEALGEYVGYLDDDCRADGRWIATALKIIDEVHPGVFGGPYVAAVESSVPRWFRYGSHVPKDEPCFLGIGEWGVLSGGNLIIRRDLIEKAGGFNPAFGKRGRKVAFGGETELLKRLFEGYREERFFYCPDLIVHHWVDPRKTSIFYGIKSRLRSGWDHFSLKGEMPKETRLRLGIRLARTLVGAVSRAYWGGVCRDREKYPYYHNFLWEEVLPDMGKAGYLWAAIRGISGGRE